MKRAYPERTSTEGIHVNLRPIFDYALSISNKITMLIKKINKLAQQFPTNDVYSGHNE